MMLGKRGRPPMRRTTSLTGITVDIGTGSEQEPSDYRPKIMVDEFKGSSEKQVSIGTANIVNDHQYQFSNMTAMVSPRYQRRILPAEGFHEVETRASFLTSCGLCNRRLGPGKDIYMYRGDTAFCSMECREQQMKQDERKEKSTKLHNSKKTTMTENHHNHSELSSTNSETSGNSETIAAA